MAFGSVSFTLHISRVLGFAITALMVGCLVGPVVDMEMHLMLQIIQLNMLTVHAREVTENEMEMLMLLFVNSASKWLTIKVIKCY